MKTGELGKLNTATTFGPLLKKSALGTESLVETSSVYSRTTFGIDGATYRATLFSSCHDPNFEEIPGTSIFLSKNYHAALTEAPPEKMRICYVRLETDEDYIGMLCFQIKNFNPGESLKKHGRKNFVNRLRYKLASFIDVSVLCLGNTLVTGNYGFCFRQEIPGRLQTLLMMHTIDWLLSQKEFKKVSLVFVKDFYEDIFKEIPGSPYCKKYHSIDTQPSMIMEIYEEWKGLSGYLSSLKSKYRVRAKKALQMASGLTKAELEYEQILQAEEVLHALYLQVVNDVGFNLFILPEGYFAALKKHLGHKFHVWVYYENKSIIGFYTSIEDGNILDAHFLGYNPDINHQYKLYLNMLLDLIDQASAGNFRQLQLSRTATEIKSSVGASGIPMWAYMRHKARFLNGFVPLAYSFFKPDLSWIPRQPFHLETKGHIDD